MYYKYILYILKCKIECHVEKVVECSIHVGYLICQFQALEWLKSSYWDPQRNLVPNVREDTESTMREMAFCLNAENIRQLDSSQTKRKREYNC